LTKFKQAIKNRAKLRGEVEEGEKGGRRRKGESFVRDS